MDPKMSVGLDTSISIGLTGTQWVPTPSPTLKLTTPALEPLQVDSAADWSNPLSAQPNPSQPTPSTSNPLNLSTGLTPRFSPGYGPLVSPGVSGEIAANVVDSAVQATTSLSDLFSCREYPFTSAPPPSTPIPPNKNRTSFLSQTTQAPGTTAVAPPKTSTSAAQSYIPAFPRPASNPVSTAQQNIPNTSGQPVAATSYPFAANTLPPRQVNVPPPPTGPAVTAVPPVPMETGKPVHTAMVTGHRSVLGSGILSSAVQQAQARARIKAESFAKERKRKRSTSGLDDKPEKLSEEDAKLTPEELKQKRYQRRLALNRESAAVSRVRRREYVKLLEEQLVDAERERVRLATELSDIQKEHNKLREQLKRLEHKHADP